MRLTDAERARETAQDLVELLAAYQQELTTWEAWTPAAATLRAGLDEAIADARDLIAATGPAARGQAH